MSRPRHDTVASVRESDWFFFLVGRSAVSGFLGLGLFYRSMSPRFGCDNKGVVHHGNHPWRPLPAKQGQADVLRYYKNLVRSAPAKCKMYHVHGHLDRYLSRSEMSPAELLNCECDHLAGAALRSAVESNNYISRILPGEDIVVSVNGCKITGSYERAITRT